MQGEQGAKKNTRTNTAYNQTYTDKHKRSQWYERLHQNNVSKCNAHISVMFAAREEEGERKRDGKRMRKCSFASANTHTHTHIANGGTKKRTANNPKSEQNLAKKIPMHRRI